MEKQPRGDRTTAPRPSSLRFATELVARVATPWALAGHPRPLAALSVVVLIGLPTLFPTWGGDKANVINAVPAWATILLLLQLTAAVIPSWLAARLDSGPRNRAHHQHPSHRTPALATTDRKPQQLKGSSAD
ncbi:hypothetical protein [Streptomyces sp. NPDC002825]|uniref:hypothetical protein n=1 Tax=Streptomyces sp. NPDC002825 TaxID=3154666 RepID=UPI0033273300